MEMESNLWYNKIEFFGSWGLKIKRGIPRLCGVGVMCCACPVECGQSAAGKETAVLEAKEHRNTLLKERKYGNTK